MATRGLQFAHLHTKKVSLSLQLGNRRSVGLDFQVGELESTPELIELPTQSIHKQTFFFFFATHPLLARSPSLARPARVCCTFIVAIPKCSLADHNWRGPRHLEGKTGAGAITFNVRHQQRGWMLPEALALFVR